MKKFEILLNNFYTASTLSISSNLDLINDYYVYITKNGGGIVNQYNVRGYLNDQKNQQITNDFFAYLTGNTSQDQALNILGSNKKLSDVFNDYYQTIILSGSNSSYTSIINQNLTGGSQIVGYTFNHPWSGYAPYKQLTGITQDINGSTNLTQGTIIWDDYTTEQSYFVPVYLERGTNQLARYKFDICNALINKKTASFYLNFSGITGAFFGYSNLPAVMSNSNQVNTLTPGELAIDNLALIDSNVLTNISAVNLISSSSADLNSAPSIYTADTKIHTLLSCFVDINLETNENVGIKILPKVSFQLSQYDVNEGDVFNIRVDLNSPSVSGAEQVVVQMVFPTPNTLSSNFNTLIPGIDFTMSQTYPTTLTWAIGEQYKNLSFSATTDLSLESAELFSLKLINPINLNIGAVESTIVNIMDMTDPLLAVIEAGQGRG